FRRRAATVWERLSVPAFSGWVLFAIFTVLYLALKFNAHFALSTFGYDLSAHDYAFYNTLHGKFMFTPFFGKSYLQEHFFPTILVALPFYALHPSTEVLLVLQALMVAATAVPFFTLSTMLIGDRRAAFFLTTALLLNPFILRGMVFDFHIEMIQPLLLCGALLCLVEGRFLGWCLLLPLLLFTKENEWLTGLMLAVTAWILGRRRYALAALALSLLAAILVQWAVTHYATGFPKYLARYAELGATPGAILLHLARDPGHLFNAHMFALFGRLLVPLAGLPLLSPVALVALPDFFVHALSCHGQQSHLMLYYGAPIVTLLMIAAAAGLGKVRACWPLLLPALMVFLLVMNVGALRFRTVTIEHRAARALAASVPAGGAVSVENELLPHLRRQRVVECIDYIDSRATEFDFILINAALHPVWDSAIKTTGFFEKKGVSGNYVLYAKKGLTPPPPGGR
ncbi:MAG: DUF2079 domain-containing protein, partial [Fibrobacterota bacterium]